MGDPAEAPTQPVVGLIARFAEVWNARDAEGLADCLAPGVVADVPRGRATGIDAVRALLERQSYGVGFYAHPRRVYGRDGRYAVEARIEYRYVETGELAAEEEGAILFDVEDGRVTRFAPAPSAEAALEEAGLGEADLLAELDA